MLTRFNPMVGKKCPRRIFRFLFSVSLEGCCVSLLSSIFLATREEESQVLLKQERLECQVTQDYPHLLLCYLDSLSLPHSVYLCLPLSLSGITDLEITYGSSLAPAGYHKVTLPDGGQAELNRGQSSPSLSFLWYSESAGKGEPIVDIRISHEEGKEKDKESEFNGYERIPRNILKGSGNSVAYLYIKRSNDVDPIGGIRILYGSQTPGRKSFSLLLIPQF